MLVGLCLHWGRVVRVGWFVVLLQGSGVPSVFWVLIFHQIVWFASFFFRFAVGGLFQLIHKAALSILGQVFVDTFSFPVAECCGTEFRFVGR